MIWRVRKPFKVFARGASLRRRVAYSLFSVRVILFPVFILAIYYLFAMRSIVDRIVNVDAPVATMAEAAANKMLDAQRDEQDYFLSHDPGKLQASRQGLADLEQVIGAMRALQPGEQSSTQKMLDLVKFHLARLDEAVSRMGEPGNAPVERIQNAVQVYERNLDNLLKRDRRDSRGRLVDDLRAQVGSFGAQIEGTMDSEDPVVRQATVDLQSSSDQVRQMAVSLEGRSWDRVLRDHHDARRLMHSAEWVLIIVSTITFILSVLVSFILPRQVVKPLVDLKEAVDHAASGNYEIEFDVKGEGEVVQLAHSVNDLIAHVREKKEGPVLKAR